MTPTQIFNLLSPLILLVAASFGLAWLSHREAIKAEKEGARTQPHAAE